MPTFSVTTPTKREPVSFSVNVTQREAGGARAQIWEVGAQCEASLTVVDQELRGLVVVTHHQVEVPISIDVAQCEAPGVLVVAWEVGT